LCLRDRSATLTDWVGVRGNGGEVVEMTLRGDDVLIAGLGVAFTGALCLRGVSAAF
jgi:hypothetical protein